MALAPVFTDTVVHKGALYDQGYWTTDLNDPTSPRRGLNEDPGKWLDHEYIPWKQIKIVRDQLIHDIDSLSDVYFKRDGSQFFHHTLTLFADFDNSTSTISAMPIVGTKLQLCVGNKISGAKKPILVLEDGSINAVDNRMINLADPVYDQDAATKKWVEEYTDNLGGDSGFVFDPDGPKQLKGTGVMVFQKQGFFVLNYNNDYPLIDAQVDRVVLAKPSAEGGYTASASSDLVTKASLDLVEQLAEAKVEDVDMDNKQYVRKNRAWQEVDLSSAGGGGGGIPEAPKIEGKKWSRDGKNERWVESPDSSNVPSTALVDKLPAVPTRGKNLPYCRKRRSHRYLMTRANKIVTVPYGHPPKGDNEVLNPGRKQIGPSSTMGYYDLCGGPLDTMSNRCPYGRNTRGR